MKQKYLKVIYKVIYYAWSIKYKQKKIIVHVYTVSIITGVFNVINLIIGV